MVYFQEDEFLMDGVNVFDRMNAAFLDKLDVCRGKAGVEFNITSSWRSKAKNKAVGGEPNSMHLIGRAVDVEAKDGAIRAKIVRAALDMGLSVGIMENAVHIDDRENGQVLFHYYAKYKRK